VPLTRVQGMQPEATTRSHLRDVVGYPWDARVYARSVRPKASSRLLESGFDSVANGCLSTIKFTSDVTGGTVRPEVGLTLGVRFHDGQCHVICM